jgi:hypothetical protein
MAKRSFISADLLNLNTATVVTPELSLTLGSLAMRARLAAVK